MWESITQAIENAEGRKFRLAGKPGAIGGGCINEARELRLVDAQSGEEARYFVKVNKESFLGQFEAEAAGLNELRASEAIRVPRPVCMGQAAGQSFFAMEFIAMGRGDSSSERLMGERLAMLHRTTAADGQFGWHRDNAIGATPQQNPRSCSWLEFFKLRRLQFQFDLAAQRGRVFQKMDAFLNEVLPAVLASHRCEPSLLHGDLWGGNAGYDMDGNPVIFDPAVYYGDRETDIAFTRMFGGFGAAFYDAYDRAWPLPDGHEVRSALYNLYHELNHFNLFGGGYGAQAENTMARLLHDTRR